jgi:hypothetical protein
VMKNVFKGHMVRRRGEERFSRDSVYAVAV